MKVSFYFAVWIIIYPLLGLLDNNFVDQNAFFIALVVVWGLSWMINRLMPETLIYERASSVFPILEDVYTGNVASFRRRLSSEALIETVSAFYFIVATAVITFTFIRSGISDIIAMLIFGLFSIGAIIKSVNLIKARARLTENPTIEQCADIVRENYRLNYDSYYQSRVGNSFEKMLPPRPRHFKAFQVFSLVIAFVTAILGLFYIGMSVATMIYGSSFTIGTIAVMYFLYGSLAAYYGIKDFVSLIKSRC